MTNIAVFMSHGRGPGQAPAPEPAERFRQNRREDYTEGVIAGGVRLAALAVLGAGVSIAVLAAQAPPIIGGATSAAVSPGAVRPVAAAPPDSAS
jgi:hypothetical protein